MATAATRTFVKLEGWRRIAHAVWPIPHDPQILGTIEVDATKLVQFIERARAAGHHVTPTHLVGRAVAEGIAAVPELNIMLRRGRAVQRPSIELFFITSIASGHDLSGVKIADADRTPAVEIARKLAPAAHALKTGSDRNFERSKRLTDRLPMFLLRPVVRFLGWFAGARGHAIRPLGLAARPFGSAMISSIGMFGLPAGYAPLSRLYRVPMLILAGRITDKPVAVEGRVEVHPVLPIAATIDHRYADAAHLARLFQVLTAYLADPAAHEPSLAVAEPAQLH